MNAEAMKRIEAPPVTGRRGVAAARYVVVSPVKDEAPRVTRTLESMDRQSLRPLRWVIVDDGSTDDTPALLASYARNRPWVRIVSNPTGTPRAPGSPVMRAFAQGLSVTSDLAFDYVVKLDCDLELPDDYFARLLAHFEAEPRLGIASGVYLEENATGHWQPVAMPDYHAAGASKVVRMDCFHDIGGFVCERGWDTVDEVRARTRGWDTRHFPDLQFRHLKPEGSGIGNLRTGIMHGEVYHATGGGIVFLGLKVAHRMVTGRPPVAGGLALGWGYLRAVLTGQPRLLDAQERAHYRLLQSRRLWLGRGRVPQQQVATTEGSR